MALPYEIKFDKNFELEDILNNPDDSIIGYSVECDLKNPKNLEDKSKCSVLS